MVVGHVDQNDMNHGLKLKTILLFDRTGNLN